VALSLCLLVHSIAAAQTEDPWSGVESMVVMGDSSFVSVLEASTSIVAFDTEYLTEAGIQNIADLAEFTPNLQINSAFAASSPELFIRGVGLRDSNSNAASAVAVIADGVYLNSPVGMLAQLFDTRGVNILRGPQGTLYGRNASAGVIEIESKPPTGGVGAGLLTTYGRFDQVDLEGFMETPIISDLLSVRVSGKFSRRDAMGKNRCAGGPPFDPVPPPDERIRQGYPTSCYEALDPRNSAAARDANNTIVPQREDVNDVKNWAARGLFLFTPHPDLEFIVNFHGGQNLGLSRSFQNAGTRKPFGGNPLTVGANFYFDIDRCVEFNAAGACIRNEINPEDGDPYDGDYGLVDDEKLNLFGTNVRAKWQLGDWLVKSITGYEQNDRDVGVAVSGSPSLAGHRFLDDEAWQVTQDLRVLWDAGGRLDAQLGIFFLYEEIEAENFFTSGIRGGLGQEVEQDTTYFGLFGFFSYELTETLTLEAGVRANFERKQFEILSFNQRISNDIREPVQFALNKRSEATDIVPTADVILRYQPIEDVGLYAKIVRGYKGRHFNAGGTSEETNVEPADPEFVNSFEMGFNTSWLDGLVNWNAATFLYNYEKQQVFQLRNVPGDFPINQLINAEDSRIFGVESDLQLAWEQLRVRVSIGYLFSEYSDFRNVVRFDIPVFPAGIRTQFDVQDFSGNRLVNAPELSITGFATYKLDLGGKGFLSPRFDFTYQSRIYTTPRNFDSVGDNSRWIFNVRLGYSDPEEHFEIAGWVRNLTDEIYRVTVFDQGRASNSTSSVISQPRSYGATLTMRF